MSYPLTPCKCGHEAQLVQVSYGRDHWSVCCSKCEQDIGADDKMRMACRMWNEANPLMVTTGRNGASTGIAP